MTDPHERIAQVMDDCGYSPQLDEALADCHDLECQACSRIVCPAHDTLHFHHDGCPSCWSAASHIGKEME
jgi:hypothetical protein